MVELTFVNVNHPVQLRDPKHRRQIRSHISKVQHEQKRSAIDQAVGKLRLDAHDLDVHDFDITRLEDDDDDIAVCQPSGVVVSISETRPITQGEDLFYTTTTAAAARNPSHPRHRAPIPSSSSIIYTPQDETQYVRNAPIRAPPVSPGIHHSLTDTPMFRHHRDLHLDGLTEEHRALCLDRVNGIVTRLKEPFDDSSALDPVEALKVVKDTWSWAGFIAGDLVPYYMTRKAELDIDVHAAGGIEKLDASVKKSVQNRVELKRIAALTAGLNQSRQSSARAKKQSLTANAVEALKAFAPTNGPPAQGMAPVAQMTPLSGQASNDPFSSAPPPGSGNLHALSQFQDTNRTPQPSAGRGRGRGRGKGKAKFNDRQSGAQRVEWDESQAQAGFVQPQPQSSVLGKRGRADEEIYQVPNWEPTQDGGPQDDEEDDQAFETKAGDLAAANARRLAAPASVPQARPFLSQAPYFGSEHNSPSMQQRAPKRRNPGSSAPHPAEYPGSAQHNPMDQDPNADPNQPPPSTSQAQDYNQAAWTARQYRILNHSTPARERRVWTDLETEALMTYINEWPEEDNLHYAAMKRKDTTDEGLHALNGRTAEDIRFRARNMKVNFLLSRSLDIHPNWNKVQLAKKEIDKLHARGVPYSQAGMRGTPAHMTTGVGGSQQ